MRSGASDSSWLSHSMPGVAELVDGALVDAALAQGVPDDGITPALRGTHASLAGVVKRGAVGAASSITIVWAYFVSPLSFIGFPRSSVSWSAL